MRFGFIEQHARTWPVRLMCRVLGVSASGYYAWRSRPESQRTMANRRLLQEVQRLHDQHQGRYGSPRMHVALRAEGHRVSRGRVERGTISLAPGCCATLISQICSENPVHSPLPGPTTDRCRPEARGKSPRMCQRWHARQTSIVLHVIEPESFAAGRYGSLGDLAPKPGSD